MAQALCSASTFALDPERSPAQYNCRTWTAQTGFPGTSINAITQTRDGFIWLGTRKGLVRYDGVEFKLLPLPAIPQFQFPGISALAPSADGGFWFGVEYGALGYYRVDQGFRALTNATWLVRGTEVLALNETRDGALWVGTSGGVFRVGKDGVAVPYPEVVGCVSILEDPHQRVWLGSRMGEVYCWESGKLNTNLHVSIRDDIPKALTLDSAGRLWIATQAKIYCFDESLRPVPTPTMPISQAQLLRDSHGALWVGATSEGLSRWANGVLTSLRQTNGLADDYVSALFEDKEGSLWVGGRKGLSLLSDVKLPIFNENDGLPKAWYLGVCTSAKGGLWAANSVGLCYFDGKKSVSYGLDSGISNIWVKRAFEASNGDLYLINGGRDIELFRNGKVVTRWNYKREWPTAIAEDQHGIIVSMGPELFRIDGDKLVPYAYQNVPPAFGWISNLSVTRDGCLLVACDNGVFRVREGVYDRFTTENGLPANKALWISEDEEEPGVIWAGLSGGLARIKGSEVKSWTTENGLFDNLVRAIVPDDYGRFWIQSGQGIFSVAKTNLMEVAGRKGSKLLCAAYDGPDAVKTTETRETEYLGCKTADGKIWFPSPDGLILVDPARVAPSTNLNPVHVQSIRANGKEQVLSGNIVIPPGRGELEIQFTAPTFLFADKQQYRYRLEGYDAGWQQVGSRRSAFYTNLRPGKYRFVVQAWNPESQSGGKVATVDIELLPFFYQTTWFHTLCAGASILALAGLYSSRVRRMQTKQRAMQAAQDRLEAEVQQRTAQLKERTRLLEREIEERERMQREVERAHRKLLEASRLAGMAEVATAVLHNVGNVLNSMNISTSVLTEQTRKSCVGVVERVAAMLKEHEGDLAHFLTSDPKGLKLPSFLAAVSKQLVEEQSQALAELKSLQKHVDHIKEIVAMQQSNAKFVGVTTIENPVELVDEGIRINAVVMAQNQIEIVREFETPLPPLVVDRHKVMQILLNVLTNARHACAESNRDHKQVKVRINGNAEWIRISVTDNGVGILPENLARIFTHGFTTRKNGHGFGLHSGALAAKEMGGELRVESAGYDQGATFILELPLRPPGMAGAMAR